MGGPSSTLGTTISAAVTGLFTVRGFEISYYLWGERAGCARVPDVRGWITHFPATTLGALPQASLKVLLRLLNPSAWNRKAAAGLAVI